MKALDKELVSPLLDESITFSKKNTSRRN